MHDDMTQRPCDTLFLSTHGGSVIRHGVNRHEGDIRVVATPQHLPDIIDQRIGQALEVGLGDDILIVRQLKRHMPLLHVGSRCSLALTPYRNPSSPIVQAASTDRLPFAADFTILYWKRPHFVKYSRVCAWRNMSSREGARCYGCECGDCLAHPPSRWRANSCRAWCAEALWLVRWPGDVQVGTGIAG